MLGALFVMPVAFLYLAVRMGLTPLNAVCLALLSATAFSTGCWAINNGPEANKKVLKLFKEEFIKQLAVVEKQLEEQKKETREYQESVETLRENFEVIADKVGLLVPSTFLFMWHFVSLVILYSGTAWLAPKLGYDSIKPFPAFKDWCFDWNLIWLYILGWVMYFLIGGIEGFPAAELIRAFGANFFVMSNILYLIAGFSLLFFMYDKYKIGAIARVGLSLVALVFAQLMVWLGIIDIWAEFRVKKATVNVSDDSDDDFLDF